MLMPPKDSFPGGTVSASSEQLIMDMFRTSRERFQSLDVMGAPFPVDLAARTEDRSLKKPSSQQQPQSSDHFLMANALGTHTGAMLTGSGGPCADPTSLGGDNFVLEWAYSVDPDDWQKLDRLNENLNTTTTQAAEDGSGSDAGSDARSEDKGSAGDGSSGKDAGAMKEDGDEEYVPEEGTSRGGRKRRATSRVAIKEVPPLPPPLLGGSRLTAACFFAGGS